MTLKIGLTGGIGSGKSTVCQIFRECGVPVVDADIIARMLVEPGKPAFQAIITAFGRQLLTENNVLDRRKLRNQIFSNSDKRGKLEAILHPAIFAEIADQLDNIHTTYCIISIPLLLETNGLEMVDRILVIDISEELQLVRTAKRDKVDLDDVQSIICTQIHRCERLDIANDVINNEGSIDDLHHQVVDLHNFYLRMASDETR